ncbi:hypothetical protein [Geodermatophilus normandii]|uniref:Uncharacterized protein n=1 Tax=Geodermatophilus normandii TaxID=1137989 RepID=A0A6P0GE63_9ACTN|nr:hypothetical protein [Geodermatophilus normandii]NEM05469.1 hypothetical protein [Geodermatophilus normandii]
MDGTTVLVACSVLPWRGAGECWRGLPDGQLDQFRAVLDHHVARIAAERQAGEPVVRGDDFDQPLLPPFWGPTTPEVSAGSPPSRSRPLRPGRVAHAS